MQGMISESLLLFVVSVSILRNSVHLRVECGTLLNCLSSCCSRQQRCLACLLPPPPPPLEATWYYLMLGIACCSPNQPCAPCPCSVLAASGTARHNPPPLRPEFSAVVRSTVSAPTTNGEYSVDLSVDRNTGGSFVVCYLLTSVPNFPTFHSSHGSRI